MNLIFNKTIDFFSTLNRLNPGFNGVQKVFESIESSLLIGALIIQSKKKMHFRYICFIELRCIAD